MIALTGIFAVVITSMFNDVGAVINGKPAELGQFKYQVLLIMTKGHGELVCGGAIIDEKHILTAWHCVENCRLEDIKVVAGTVGDQYDPNAVLYRVSDIRLHQSRSSKPNEIMGYDIAILTTTEVIEYTPYINPIDLPYEDIEPGTECIFAGWGGTEYSRPYTSNVLRYGYGRVWHYSLCKAAIVFIHDYEMCFSHIVNNASTIYDGDSGSPLVCDGVLTGVIIRGGGFTFDQVTAINTYKLLEFIYEIDESTCS